MKRLTPVTSAGLFIDESSWLLPACFSIIVSHKRQSLRRPHFCTSRSYSVNEHDFVREPCWHAGMTMPPLALYILCLNCYFSGLANAQLTNVPLVTEGNALAGHCSKHRFQT